MNEHLINKVMHYPNYQLTKAFRATIDATEEAIVNAMVAADTMVGADSLRVKGIPKDKVRALFKNH